MRRTEAWWVCNKCKKPVIKKGSKGVHMAVLEHRKTCGDLAGFSLRQVEQKGGA